MTLAETVLACATSIVLGSMWLSARVVKWVYEPEAKPDEFLPTAPPDMMGASWIRPWHSAASPCALCDQTEAKLAMIAGKTRLADDGTNRGVLRWACPVCRGQYTTWTKS